MMNRCYVNNLIAISVGSFCSLSLPNQSIAQDGNSIPIPRVGVSRQGNPLVTPPISNTTRNPFNTDKSIAIPKNLLGIKREKLAKGIIHIPNNAIQIDIQGFNRPFLIRNINRRFHANELIPFLRDYFEGSKAERTNPIIIRQNTKVLMPGEDQFKDFLQRLSEKHEILAVHMPAPMSAMTDQAFENYAKRKLTPVDNHNRLNQKESLPKKTKEQWRLRNEGSSGR